VVTRPVVVISASIGAGHDGAAREITRRLTGLGLVVDRYDFLDLVPPGVGAAVRTAYASQMRLAPQSWGKLLDMVGEAGRTDAVIRLSHRLGARRVLAAAAPAAAVVSTYPLASQVLGLLRAGGQLTAPVAAVMTDPSVHPLCVASGVDVHLAPGRACAAELSRYPAARTTAVSSLVDPRFRPARDAFEIAAAREQFGLPLDARPAVVLAGSWGVGDVAETARDLAGSGFTAVVVCGRNASLRRRIAADGTAIALGWVSDMPLLLRAAEVVVHNAGGLSSMEAIAAGVPIVSYRCLPGHGVANAAVLAAAGLSPWPQTPVQFRAVLLRPAVPSTPEPPDPDAADIVAALAGTPDVAAVAA
jgi:UDP-N-acetylglucosamine:LPS N-acetylglucosamine transferase